MAITLADLYQRTGAKLGILRADESLSAEDGDLIADTYASLHDQLLSEGLATWGVSDAVPDWVAPILVELLAAMLVDQFGIEEPRRSALRAEGVLGNAPVSPAERRLRRQLSLPYVPANIHTEYF
jgi:hypothetical protein